MLFSYLSHMRPFLTASILISIMSIFGCVEKSQPTDRQNQYVYLNPADSSFNCYMVKFPATDSIRGVVIRDYSSLPDTSKSPYQFNDLCSKNGLVILYTVTSKRFPELYYFDEEMARLDSLIHHACRQYNLPTEHLLMGGISASGTRALRFAQYCSSGKSVFNTQLKGVFSVDSPLDVERFYTSASTHKDSFTDGMRWEADLVLKQFPDYLGVPDSSFSAYRNASVYSQFDSTGGNIHLLKNTPILFVHEPDLDWWKSARGAEYFDINSYDISACVKQLRAMGNTDVTEIITSGKGFDHDGNRKCHSWTIVDEETLVDWILEWMNRE